MDEDAALLAAMRRLAGELLRGASLGRAAYAYWSANHTLDAMTADYERLMPAAAARPAPAVSDLPSHFTEDHSARARAITNAYGLALEDVLGSTF